MALLPVEEALARLLSGVRPLGAETVPLAEAPGRVLAADLAATRTQPPFPASAMDGYAVRAEDAGSVGARLTVIGESQAGRRFDGSVGPGQAVRIFTGAPVPDGADAILIQEDAERDGAEIRVLDPVTPGRYVRPAGLDFAKGDVLLKAGRMLGPRALALAAAMNHAAVPVVRRPKVSVLSTGDELVRPGAEPGPDQIISSNGIGLSSLVRAAGGAPDDLGIAPDDRAAIGGAVDRAAGSDVLVVIGGASVGDHDLVQEVLVSRGMTLDFWQIAMRPGKPLMVGHLDGTTVLGLPGNPVSALVCGAVFVKPLIRTMLGRPPSDELLTTRLGSAMGANDHRQDYVRARLETRGGEVIATPFSRQDSSMLATLAEANALIVRPPNAPPAQAGEPVSVLLLDD